MADGIRQAGQQVCAIGLAGQYDPTLIRHCDQFQPVGMARLGKWIRTLRRWHVREAIMVGRVAHTRKYARFQFLRYTPDWRAIKLWYRELRHDRRTGAMLSALADELKRSGVTLIDSTTHIQEHLASPGVMTQAAPAGDQTRDVEFGWQLLLKVVELGAGQSVAVRGCDVVAVEAAEGTDAMIERAGTLCRGRNWCLFKTCSRDHDMRADVPTIGVGTIERFHDAGGKVIVLGAGRVIMIDKPDVLKRADKLGIAIVGME